MGKEFEKKEIHVYGWLNHFAVHLKLVQDCKSTVLQYEIKKCLKLTKVCTLKYAIYHRSIISELKQLKNVDNARLCDRWLSLNICVWLYTGSGVTISCSLFVCLLAVLSLCCWVGFPLVAVVSSSSRVVQASRCGDFSCCGARALGAWASVVAAYGLQNTGSVVVWYGLRCSEACGLFPGRGLHSYLLHWQVDSLPLSHQGSPAFLVQLRSVVLNKVLATNKEMSSSTSLSSSNIQHPLRA